jgi:hypothetical protein
VDGNFLKSGDYTFYLATDDHFKFLFSTVSGSTDPANLT